MRSGELMPLALGVVAAPLSGALETEPLAGEDRKKSGEDVGGFNDESCEVLFALGVACDCCELAACDASDLSWSFGPYGLLGASDGGSDPAGVPSREDMMPTDYCVRVADQAKFDGGRGKCD